VEDFGQFPGNNFSSFGEDASGQLFIAGLTSGTIYRVLENPTGIIDYGHNRDIKVTRSPSSGKIRIETGDNELREIKADFYNILGTNLFTGGARAASYEFDPGEVTAGIYFLKIWIDGKVFVRKLIIGN